jgi:hypothetical protein
VQATEILKGILKRANTDSFFSTPDITKVSSGDLESRDRQPKNRLKPEDFLHRQTQTQKERDNDWDDDQKHPEKAEDVGFADVGGHLTRLFENAQSTNFKEKWPVTTSVASGHS